MQVHVSSHVPPWTFILILKTNLVSLLCLNTQSTAKHSHQIKCGSLVRRSWHAIQSLFRSLRHVTKSWFAVSGMSLKVWLAVYGMPLKARFAAHGMWLKVWFAVDGMSLKVSKGRGEENSAIQGKQKLEWRNCWRGTSVSKTSSRADSSPWTITISSIIFSVSPSYSKCG